MKKFLNITIKFKTQGSDVSVDIETEREKFNADYNVADYKGDTMVGEKYFKMIRRYKKNPLAKVNYCFYVDGERFDMGKKVVIDVQNHVTIFFGITDKCFSIGGFSGEGEIIALSLLGLIHDKNEIEDKADMLVRNFDIMQEVSSLVKSGDVTFSAPLSH